MIFLWKNYLFKKMIIIPYDNTKGFNIPDYNNLASSIRDLPNGKWQIDIKKPQRTIKQNAALHKWFTIISEEMNQKGVPLSVKIGNKQIDRQWDADEVKNNLFRPTMKAILKKQSTTQLNTKEVDKICAPIIDWLIKEWEIVCFFPSQYELSLKTLTK